jgi:hypothetical protein
LRGQSGCARRLGGLGLFPAAFNGQWGCRRGRIARGSGFPSSHGVAAARRSRQHDGHLGPAADGRDRALRRLLRIEGDRSCCGEQFAHDDAHLKRREQAPRACVPADPIHQVAAGVGPRIQRVRIPEHRFVAFAEVQFSFTRAAAGSATPPIVSGHVVMRRLDTNEVVGPQDLVEDGIRLLPQLLL